MKRRRLGGSGITVSDICMGTMTFGSQCDEPLSFRIMDRAFDAGVDFFDAAEMYPVPPAVETYGRTEEIVGRWLKTKPREAVIVATKITGPAHGWFVPPVRHGHSALDRVQLTRAVDASLRRLQTDYIDLYQTHWPDHGMRYEDILEPLTRLVEQGKIRAIGCSNETCWAPWTPPQRRGGRRTPSSARSASWPSPTSSAWSYAAARRRRAPRPARVQNRCMPEGDTVWLAARRLDDCLAGDVLTAADLRVPHLATVDLSGRTVEQVRAYGKHLLFGLDDGRTLHTHFRMDGSWHLYRHGRPWKGGPEWQVRAVLETRDWQAVGYRLPVVELLDARGQEALLGRLGPDILADDVDIAQIVTQLQAQPDRAIGDALLDDAVNIDEIVARLGADPERAIGDALLDQSIVAGFGLIYVSETLFLRGIPPQATVGTIVDLPALVRTGRNLMGANRARGAQASTGNLREQHYVYGRAGRPCLRCGTRISFAKQRSGPYERDAYWCPHCQPSAA